MSMSTETAQKLAAEAREYVALSGADDPRLEAIATLLADAVDFLAQEVDGLARDVAYLEGQINP